MKKLQICTLGSEDKIIANVKAYMAEHDNYCPVWSDDDAIDYINEHAGKDDESPEVYVGTYHKYACGSLSGMWVNIDSFRYYDEFIEFCKAIHGDEEDPELMYQDFQYFPEALYCESGIYEDTFDHIKEYAECENKEAAMVYLDYTLRDSLEDFEDCFVGEWDSEEAFAWHIYEEFYEHEIPECLSRYFDIEALARDLFSDGYVYTGGFVFQHV